MSGPIFLNNDHTKTENVYRKTEDYFASHEDIYEKIKDTYFAHHAIWQLIPLTTHYFAYGESLFELENSLELCRQGFYRYSYYALRCVLELGLMGVYFDKESLSHREVHEWHDSRIQTPNFAKKVIRELFKGQRFDSFNKVFQIKREIEMVHSSINDYVHMRGLKFSSTHLNRTNYNAFNEDALRRFVEYLTKVVREIVTLMLLKYPIGMQLLPLHEKFGTDVPFGFMYEGARSTVLKVLDENVKNYLQEFSNNDLEVKAKLGWVNSLPDITDDEIERQIEE